MVINHEKNYQNKNMYIVSLALSGVNPLKGNFTVIVKIPVLRETQISIKIPLITDQIPSNNMDFFSLVGNANECLKNCGLIWI